jgi:hypothetical protein
MLTEKKTGGYYEIRMLITILDMLIRLLDHYIMYFTLSSRINLLLYRIEHVRRKYTRCM